MKPLTEREQGELESWVIIIFGTGVLIGGIAVYIGMRWFG